MCWHIVQKKRSRSCGPRSKGCFHLGSSFIVLPPFLPPSLSRSHSLALISASVLPSVSFMSACLPRPARKLVYIIFGMPTSGRPSARRLSHGACVAAAPAGLIFCLIVGLVFMTPYRTTPRLSAEGFHARHLAKCDLLPSASTSLRMCVRYANSLERYVNRH